MRDLERPGRSPVHATHGMAATSQPLATLTAINLLQDGGNAMDAAVAACAVQCVVEPGSTGIGGDCFALYAPAGGPIVGFNGSGRAPAAATADWYAEQGIAAIERTTPHAVTVPGAIDAWSRLLADHGTRSLGEVLGPAIGYARDGYPVHSRTAHDFALSADILMLDPTAARIYLPGGRPPKAGTVHRQPELAETLAHIAEHGRDGFYRGHVAGDIVSHLRSLGGLHTLDDFAAARGEYVEPITVNYRGYDIYECPPNGQGVTALQMLNILAHFDLAALDPLSVDRFHLLIEATRLAYRERDSLVADPGKADVPVEWMLSDKRASEFAGAIDMDRASGAGARPRVPEHADTVYLCVVDKDRNAVSFINSLFSNFGSGLCAPKTGVMLQNRGIGFVLDSDHPNCIAPNKRPLHTIIPGMVAKDGEAVMPFGVMGGHYQAVGHATFLTNLIDFGLDPQEAIDFPRVFATPGGKVEVEGTVPEDIRRGLEDRGHELTAPGKPIGGGQAIRIDRDEGVLTGASEPRKDGCALGY